MSRRTNHQLSRLPALPVPTADLTSMRAGRRSLLVAGGASLALAGLSRPALAQSAPLKMQVALTFVAMGRFAAFYLAKERGYYRDAGLDVTIRAAGSAALGFQMLST